MKYISICSGIEAATVAWHGFGWTPLAFSEIEPFPSAVLANHWPDVPNLGDMTKYDEWPEELLAECDLLVGGPPCQAFSVAGLRKSLDDDRGNITLAYVRLLNHIDEVRKRHGRPPAIALYENVPGLLSTKDNAFGCLVGALAGCDEAPETEKGKWPKAGFLCGETRRVGYRTIDAQYFGVAQRRRRVFLIAVPCELVERFGERACPSEILSLRESVRGNPPTRLKAGEGAAAAVEAGAGSGSEPCYLDRAMFNQGVNAQYEPDAVMWSASDQANAERLVETAGTLNCNMGQRGGWIAPTGHPDPAYALSAGNQSKGGVFGSGRDSQDTFVTQPVAFTKSKRAQSTTDDETWVDGEVTPTINVFDTGDTRATTVVAFKPGQSEAAGGFLPTENFAPTIQSQNNGSTAVPAVAYGIRGDAGREGVAKTPSADAEGRVRLRNPSFNPSEELSPTIDASQPHAVAFTQNSRDEIRQINGDGQLAAALSAEQGMHQTNYIAFSNRTRDGLKVPEVMKDGVAPALTNPGGGGRSDAVNVCLPQPVAFTTEQTPKFSSDKALTITKQSPSGGGQPQCVMAAAMQVRRLTPLECEFLQGFPPQHTNVTFRKKPAADGPRYRALGNSMAVPCMWWLGNRIRLATQQDT